MIKIWFFKSPPKRKEKLVLSSRLIVDKLILHTLRKQSKNILAWLDLLSIDEKKHKSIKARKLGASVKIGDAQVTMG